MSLVQIVFYNHGNQVEVLVDFGRGFGVFISLLERDKQTKEYKIYDLNCNVQALFPEHFGYGSCPKWVDKWSWEEK